MPPPVDPNLVKKEQAALKKVTLKSFTANPRTVKTFGSTTLSWNVTVPESEFDIFVKLNDEVVAPTGSKTRALQQTTSFRLSASTENAGRLLRTVSVTVDASECKANLLDAFVITQRIKTAFNQRFSGSSKFKLRDGGTEVTLSDGAISIGVRLEIEVPNWFNANMNIGIQLSVLGPERVKVASKNVSVNVSWGFFEHLASLGCTGFVQSGMEQLAREFMADIVDAEVAPAIAAGFNEELDKFLDSLKETDPPHRDFVMTFLTVSPAGVSFTACPK
jgi:hypothetical protein